MTSRPAHRVKAALPGGVLRTPPSDDNKPPSNVATTDLPETGDRPGNGSIELIMAEVVSFFRQDGPFECGSGPRGRFEATYDKKREVFGKIRQGKMGSRVSFSYVNASTLSALGRQQFHEAAA